MRTAVHAARTITNAKHHFGTSATTDAFRSQIWNRDAVVYDNAITDGKSAPEGSNAATPIGGGNIVIHP